MTGEEYKRLSLKEFDRAAAKFDDDDPSVYNMCRKDYPDVLAETVREPFSDLLDAGCGTGTMLGMFKRDYPDKNYTGVDLSKKMIQTAKIKHLEGIRFVAGDWTGRLFSEEKDAIILQVSAPASNYGAATVFVLNVNPVGVDPIPTVTVKLDTENSITLADGNVIENSVLSNNVTDGTKIVDVSGMPRQGVLIYFIDENGQYQGLQRIFYWTDDGWTVISG